MKRLCIVALSLALMLLTSGFASWHTTAKLNCEGMASDCCQRHEHSQPQKTSSGAACTQCCLVCCAYISPETASLISPQRQPIYWQLRHASALSRVDEPPVPPPRWS